MGGAPEPTVWGAPPGELRRSPAATRVGRMAASSGLFLSHFEHRLDLPWPEHWEPVGRPDLGAPGGWRGGFLPETKFRSFRADRLIGSLHPGHRAKWTAHELCHGLVGFAWRPDASLLWHAMAARLAEVLPVALWYFFDEAGLRRCPAHAGGGPLFNGWCVACERIAPQGPVEDPEAEGWADRGIAYLEREIEAVRRTISSGRVIPNRYATLELGSDGLGYVAAHGAVLRSDAFRRYVGAFHTLGEGWFDDLEAFSGRVMEVANAIAGRGVARTWSGDRWRWASQDVGWRLIQVAEDCGGPLREALDEVIDGLAADQSERGLARAVDAYVALHGDWVAPAPRDLFAVGYPLPGGFGSALEQLGDGVYEVCPGTWRAMGDEARRLVVGFASVERPARVPLARRFAAFLAAEGRSGLADQARLEAAVAHAGRVDEAEQTLGLDGWGGRHLRLGAGVELLELHHAVALDGDDHAFGEAPEPVDVPLRLAVFRDASGGVNLAELDDQSWSVLRTMGEGTLDRADLIGEPQRVDELLAMGLLRPAGWSVDA